MLHVLSATVLHKCLVQLFFTCLLCRALAKTVGVYVCLAVVAMVQLRYSAMPSESRSSTSPTLAASSSNSNQLQPGAYVVLSTGSAPLYSFLLPIAAVAWSRRQQVQPILLLTHDVPGTGLWGSDPQTAVILKYLRVLGFEHSITFLSYDPALPLNNVAISQVARAYAAGLCSEDGPLATAAREDAFLIVTDVDILPIANLSYFLPSSPAAVGRITNAFCCPLRNPPVGGQFREFPMSTIAYRASTWRQLMGYEGCICRSSSASCLTHDFHAHINGDLMRRLYYNTSRLLSNQWGMDQWMVSSSIHNHPAVLNGTELQGRQVQQDLLQDRIDRAGHNWPKEVLSQAALGSFIDAHVVRPGYTADNWGQLSTLLRSVLMVGDSASDQQLWHTLQAYAAEYRAAVDASAQFMLMPDAAKG
jgi:hypothetical protein